MENSDASQMASSECTQCALYCCRLKWTMHTRKSTTFALLTAGETRVGQYFVLYVVDLHALDVLPLPTSMRPD